MTDASTAKIAQAIPSTYDGDFENRCTSTPKSSTERTVQEKIGIWRAQLDAIMNLVNAGKLMQAWSFVTRIMREIEFCDGKTSSYKKMCPG